MNDLQAKQAEERRSLASDLPAGDADGIPSSLVALDRLLQEATEKEDADVTSDLVQQLCKVVQGVKSEFRSLLAAKETAEARLRTTIATDETMEYELACARESLRGAREKLIDSHEEANRLRDEVSSLSRRTKRTPHDTEEEVEELEETETGQRELQSKRHRRDDDDAVSTYV